MVINLKWIGIVIPNGNDKSILRMKLKKKLLFRFRDLDVYEAHIMRLILWALPTNIMQIKHICWLTRFQYEFWLWIQCWTVANFNVCCRPWGVWRIVAVAATVSAGLQTYTWWLISTETMRTSSLLVHCIHQGLGRTCSTFFLLTLWKHLELTPAQHCRYTHFRLMV